ncbi:MAG: hypothetical protein ABH867_04540 [Patescibacteria group bacterium]
MNPIFCNVTMETDYTKIKVHPLFKPIKKLFEFYILGIGFIGMPEFQRAFLLEHPGMKPLIDAYNKEVSLQKEGQYVKASTRLYLIYVGRLMAVAVFDFLQASPFHKVLSGTEIFRFTKHIRNGAAHNNKFNFGRLNPLEKPAKWKNKNIDNSLNGKTVIPDFINPTELIFLMSDISSLIKVKTKKK